ncbi:gliding motility-associated C-terminal domain-containing protein [Flavivirga spongiicola]|uniref:Gliding motility-associated C-terminal domain-containing protein n=1 Tax=Flavivirga spongiicola TaxID=421621 RepID=A0ABU7XY30_9FLAO|nr:gliding motility-associated C-terminal domain-containing protein [Flavivirga sp. MEBiC05379]MDO5980693.1 gliding motility-associated C-terminal domain-containing protein [Flavivirga sp. MEBiC05379]
MKKLYAKKTFANIPSIKLMLFAFLLIIAYSTNSYSQVRVPFTPRTSDLTPTQTIYNIKGDFTMMGNTNLTLVDYDETSANDGDMKYVDEDGTAVPGNNTFNSSSATLTFSTENGAIPDCSNILFAGLYWVGRAGNGVDNNDDGDNNPHTFQVTKDGITKSFDKRKVSIKGPGASGYTELTADPSDIHYPTGLDPSNNYGLDSNIFTAYTEVTQYVRDNGLGEYFVADIALNEGSIDINGYSGGWGMVIVYENALMKWRNVTVFDGYAFVEGNNADEFEFDINGFNAVQTGDVNVKLGLMASEGELRWDLDYFEIEILETGNYQRLANNRGATNNFFDSTIETGGNARLPDLINNTGLDIVMFDIPNPGNSIIGNSQTNTSFRYGSSRDTFMIFNTTFSVDAYVPEPEGILTNTLIDGNAPGAGNTSLEPNENADFAIQIRNKGTEATNNTVITIPLPPSLGSIDPNDLNINSNIYPPLVSTLGNPTYNPAIGSNGAIEWNIGTLPVPVDPDTLLADISFSLTVTTDCSILSDPNLGANVTVNGTISGVGAISNSSFNNPLVQGYESTGPCIGDPIPVPIIIPIESSDYVNEAPVITAPSPLDIEGCDENDITALNARYPYSASQSVDIKDTYVTTGYTASDNGTIVSITYTDVITQNSSCQLIVTRTFTATDDCDNITTAVQVININDTIPALGTTPAGTTNINICASETEIDAIATTAADITALETAYTDDCGTVTATFVSQSLTGDACAWSLERTYNISDGCPANDFTVTITHSGSDQDPASGTTPAGTTDINACASETEIDTIATTAADITALETAYTDDCGTVTATFVSQSLTGDACTWSLERTYNISDGCPANDFTVTITHSGSDQDPASGTTPAGTTDINACASETEIDTIATTAADITALETAYTDDCGTVTATFVSQSLTGDACTWSLERTYNISDGCPANDFTVTITHSGSDQDPASGTTPAGTTNINACASETEIDTIATTAADITALETAYTDDCGTVTATFVSQSLTGDACTWSLERTYNISDGCPANDFTVTITHSGSDQDPASGTTPAGTTDINACASETEIDTIATTAADITALETAYTDDCGTVTATFVSQSLTGDACTWSLERTYNISDGCPANDFTVTITHSGSDQDPASGTTPAGTTNINACASETEIDTIATTAADITALETAYTDDCGTVTATFVSQSLTGDACTWSLERTYNISDGCPANDFTVTITHSGSDQDPASGTTPAGTTNINACASETEIDTIATTVADITALETAYTDDCGTVTATFLSQSLTGDACAWSLERTYNISDGCPANDFTVTITHSGSDQDPASGITPAGTTDINACASETEIDTIATTAADITALETAYTDDCGTVAATFVSQSLTGDACAWSLERTYNISDGCPANDFTVTITHSGSDQDPASGITPAGTTDINACASETEIDTIATTAADITALETAYTDDCGTVTATFLSQSLTGDACAWSLERTYNISDGCPANDFTVTITHSGSDQDPASGITPDGTTDINACASETEIDTIATTAADITALETAYTDDCGTVTATFLSQSLTGDACAWSLERTYNISDGCPANDFTVTITHSGSDQINPIIDNTNLANIEIECGTGDTQTTLTAWLNSNAGATATDNCSTVTWDNDYGLNTSVQCNNGAITVTFTAEDTCGNKSSTTATYLIKDTVAPNITTQASNETVQCDGAGNLTNLNDWLANNGGATATDDCSTVTWSNNFNSLSDDCGATGSVTVIFSAIDACNNTSTTTATFTIEDNTDPQWTNAPADLTVQCDGTTDPNGAFAAWLTSFSGTDTCGTATVTNNSNGLSDLCGATGSETVTFFLTDECGNDIELDATFTIVDTADPEWTNPPADLTVECDGTTDPNGAFAAWLTSFSGTDACGTATVTNNSNGLSDLCGATGSETVTFFLTDECGNDIELDATFTIVDTADPEWTNPPADLTVECDGTTDPNGAFAAWLTSFSGTDACGTATVTNNSTGLSDLCGATGSETVTFFLTDECGNDIELDATFTIVDTADPEWTNPPADLTVECDGTTDPNGAFAAWLTSFSGTDACGTATVTNNSTGLSDLCGATGAETVTFFLTDECGNDIELDATFTIVDTADPEWTNPPADLTVECDGTTDPNGAFAAWLTSFSGTDACGTATVTNNSTGLSDLCGATGSETVTFFLTDECGNDIELDATFTIVDTLPPVLSLPSNATAECSDDLTTIAFGTATATDNCDPTPTITFEDDIEDGACPNTFKIIRTWTATDSCGNSVSANQEISTADTTAPKVSGTIAEFVVEGCSVTDAPAPVTSIAELEDFGLNITDNCTDNANLIVTNSDTSENSCPIVITRSYTIKDACGNSITITHKINIVDTTPPVFSSLPNDQTVECSDNLTPSSLGTAVATDDCGTPPNISFEDVRTNGDCPNNYTIARTWTATDECGLETKHTQIITVQDTKAPEPTTTFEEILNVSCTDIPDIPELTFADNCSTNITVVFNETNSYEENVFVDYEIVRTWIVRDECDNEKTYTQTLQVALDEVITDLAAPDWCYDEGAINMNNLLPDDLNTNGTWELLEGDPAATLNANIFDPSGLELSVDFLPESGGIDYKFRYTTTDEGCISITEVTMNVHADCVVLPCGENDITISKAVTPNGDAYNEFFEISGIELCGFIYDVKIFNRWGALVYESDNYQNDWNGAASSGSIGTAGKVPNGTYYYIIKLQNSGLNPITGPVYLGTK